MYRSGRIRTSRREPTAIEGMELKPATQPSRASGLKSTDFSVIPDQDSENALPAPSPSRRSTQREPLVVSEWYSATQFIVRETVLQSGSEFMISPPDFSAHGLQATDATLPNYISGIRRRCTGGVEFNLSNSPID